MDFATDFATNFAMSFISLLAKLYGAFGASFCEAASRQEAGFARKNLYVARCAALAGLSDIRGSLRSLRFWKYKQVGHT